MPTNFFSYCLYFVNNMEAGSTIDPPTETQTSFSSVSCSIVDRSGDVIQHSVSDGSSFVDLDRDRISSDSQGSICFGDDPTSINSINILPLPAKVRKSKRNAKSAIWNYFEVYTDKAYKDLAVCMICNNDVNYSASMSTTMLLRHLRSKHRDAYDALVEEDAKKKLKSDSDLKTTTVHQSSLTSFMTICPSFQESYLEWVIDTYQPISSCEYASFRKMCFSLNGKAPVMGREKVRILLNREAATVRLQMKDVLAGRFWSGTTDCWTSCNNVTFVACTAHFVDPDSWTLLHFPLGIFEKKGRSKAEDVVRHVEHVWNLFDLHYTSLVCLVTDTEATMIKAGRIFIANSTENGGRLAWHGCVDHILELVTGVAMKDYNQSAGAMAKARELVGFFSSSSQAEAILLSKQAQGKAVKCIQDVCTRWWSTYSMCSRLLRLKQYFYIMELEGSLDCNLNEEQWKVIEDTCRVLEPFMVAQKLLEGENYVTVSFVPFLIFSIRKGLQAILVDDSSSAQVLSLVTTMLSVFDKHWGVGTDGTVATEHLSVGPNRRPKGIPLLTLLASLVDPRFKTGPGLSDEDKSFLWDEILEEMVVLARVDINRRHQEQEAHRQLHPIIPDAINNNNATADDDVYAQITQLAAAEGFHQCDGVGVAMEAVELNAQERASAELLLYRREPPLPTKNPDGSFTNPLDWWRVKHHQFPLLSKLAIKYLAIPATSAPSERVFSTAGITIANERAKLDPKDAGDLVFLHDAVPAMRKYNRSINN